MGDFAQVDNVDQVNVDAINVRPTRPDQWETK